ncbi:MAG: hypothetical protein ACON49_02990 [Candidatus Puniceispirillaceae bacterium]
MISCGYCHGDLSSPTHTTSAYLAGSQQKIYEISCDDCEQLLHIGQDDYDMLRQCHLLCPSCLSTINLPFLPEAWWKTFGKLGVIYVFLLASLALLVTPQGSQLIHDLVPASPEIYHMIITIKAAFFDSLAVIKGLFL